MGVCLGDSVYNNGLTKKEVEEMIEENGKGVFFADYNVTSYNDVLAAYNDGKIVIAKYTDSGTDYYLTLWSFGSDTFNFVCVENEKLLIKCNLVSGGWGQVYTMSIGLPTTTPADNEKVLTVDSSGNASFEYLPVGKLGIETPLVFKKDTAKETVIGFNSKSSNYLDILRVDKTGEPKFEPIPFVKFGIESPLKFNETDEKTEILWDVAVAEYGMFLFARPSSDGGGVVWRYACEVIHAEFNGGAITIDKTWQDIVRVINYDIPIRLELHFSTNEWYFFDLDSYANINDVWRAVFTKWNTSTDGGGNYYFRRFDIAIKEDNTVSYSITKPAYEP